MKKFPPIFYFISLANFIFFLGDALFILFPIFLKDLGASESYIGFMNNIDKIFIIVTALMLGTLIHGKDRIRILRYGYILLFVVFSSYLLISSISWFIVIIRIFHGIGFSIATILASTIVFDSIPKERAAEAIGIYGITGAVSLAISPTVGEWLLRSDYPHYILFVISIVHIILCIAISFIMTRSYEIEEVSASTVNITVLKILKNKQFLLFGVVTFIFGGVFGIIITYLPNFIRSTTSFKYSYFFIMFFISLIILRFTVLKYISDRNRNYIILSVLILGVIMNLLMNGLNSQFVLISVGLMYGVTHGVLYPVLNATLVGIVPGVDKGKSNSLFSAFMSSGIVFFSIGFGFLIDYYGTYLVAFNGAAVSFVISILIILFIIKKNW